MDEITAFVLCNIIVIRLMGRPFCAHIIFFWSRQKSDTNMKKNSAWPWIRRIRCVSSFHCCKSWIITDVKLKDRRLIILDNLCSNSKRFWGFFWFFLEDIYYQKIISDTLLNVFVSNKKLWMILKNKFNNMDNFGWQILCCGKPWIYIENEPPVSKLRNLMNAGQ